MEKKKNNILKIINNASSMMIFLVFLVMCVGIAAVIGVYSVKKVEQNKETNSSVNNSAAQEQSGETARNTEEEKSTEEAGKEVVFEDCGEDGVLVTMIHTGEWRSKNELFTQYDIYIDNTTGQEIRDWRIRIKVGEEAACNNIWNGEAKVTDGVLTVTPAEFNKSISSKTQATVGIIIQKAGALAFENISFK